MAHRSITRLLPWLTVGLGLLLTAGAWHLARVREEREVADRFQTEAAQVGRAAAWEIALFTDVLQSLGSLHALSDRVTAYDFEEFARKGLTHQKSVLGAFGFAQWIPATLRPALEEPGPDGLPTRRLTEYDPEQGVRPAAERPDYFPLTYQYPEAGLGLPNSFDLATLPEAGGAIQRMASSSRPALGPRTVKTIRAPTADLSTPESPTTGYYIFAPIFNEDASLSGFTVAILWPQDLLRRALDRTLARGVQVTLYDPAAGLPPVEAAATLRREEPVQLADLPWVLRCEALPVYVAAHATPLPWLVLVSGLVVTLLLTVQTGGLVQRAARIEATVRERTAELQEANLRLAGEMQERARLEVELEEVADREKRRIGHDLHDSLGQKLTGAVYLSKALAASLGPESGEALAGAEKINEILKDAVAEVRRTARGLAPVEVGEAGLAQALHRLAEDTCSVYGIVCSFRAEGEVRIRDARMAAQLYHIGQEALTNAVRHGEAREVQLLLVGTSSGGQLIIRDHGKGFDPAATRSDGVGLRIMRHRAHTIGGTLEVESSNGSGATVTCRFPTSDPYPPRAR
jgi:signal transduction histidine kinase